MKTSLLASLILTVGTNAVAASDFDCRPFLLSKAIWKGEKRKRAVNHLADLTLVLIPFDWKQNHIAHQKEKKIFDFINIAAFLAMKPTRAATSWDWLLPTNTSGLDKVSFPKYTRKRSIEFAGFVNNLRSEAKSRGIYTDDYFLHQKIHTAVEIMNSGVCVTCFCKPRQNNPLNDVTSWSIFEAYKYLNMEEAQQEVSRRVLGSLEDPSWDMDPPSLKPSIAHYTR